MAPNRRQLFFLSESLSEIGPLVRDKMAAAPATISAEPARESPSYWDWPSDQPPTPADLFSAARLEANLIQDAATASAVESRLVAEHDVYWAESSSSADIHVSVPQHDAVQVDDVDAYWAETNHASNASDAYWDEASSFASTRPPRKATFVATANLASYWDEANHAPTASDVYWREASATDLAAADNRS